MPSMSVLVEVCCSSIDDAIRAQEAGADRVELCSCLFFGGLTPSIGCLIEARKRLRIPIIAMVRPRGGGFDYTEAEFASMLEDARALVAHGADGLVFGCLHQDGTVDVERNRQLVDACQGKEAVFHRAFDATPDPFAALETLIQLGVTRVLTSGQEEAALLGADLIAEVVRRAAGRIEILPGGPIHPRHIEPLLARTGVNQIHIAAWEQAEDNSTSARPHVTFGGALFPPENRYDIADLGKLRRMTEISKGV